MLKKDFVISASLKILALVILIIFTSIVISAAGSRELPLLSESLQEYSIKPESENSRNGETSSDGEESIGNPVPEDSFEGSLYNIPLYNESIHSNQKISSDVFVGQAMTRQNITELIDGSRVSGINVRMGYIFISYSDGGEKIYSSKLDDLTDILAGCEFIGQRDKDGDPVFLKDGKYYYLDDSYDLKQSDYNRQLDNRGFAFDVPYYLGAPHPTYKKVISNGYYGFRDTAKDQYLVRPVDNNYNEAFGYSAEGVVTFINKNTGMLCFHDDKWNAVLKDKYYPSEDRGIFSIGYYYFDNMMTRVRVKSGSTYVERLMYYDGKLVTGLPDGYNIKGYSDGCVLLEKDGYYGFVNSGFKWIANPVYTGAQPYLEGFAVVRGENGKYGVINTEGKTVIAMVFDRIYNCSDGIIIGYEKENGYYLFAKYEG